MFPGGNQTAAARFGSLSMHGIHFLRGTISRTGVDVAPGPDGSPLASSGPDPRAGGDLSSMNRQPVGVFGC